jgi:hypothetical protein
MDALTVALKHKLCNARHGYIYGKQTAEKLKHRKGPTRRPNAKNASVNVAAKLVERSP